MIQVFKANNGIDDINRKQFFKLSDYNGTRDSHNKLFIQYALTQCKKRMFSKCAPVWNIKLLQLNFFCYNLNFMRLLDELFFHQNKFYYDEC